MLLRQEPAIFVCPHYNGIPIVSYMILNSESVVRINKTFDESRLLSSRVTVYGTRRHYFS